MKKYFFLFLLTALFSCNNSDKVSVEEPNPHRDSLNTENERLKDELTQKDSAVNSFMQSFNEIQENLTIIKEKEKIITESKGDVKNKKDQIVEDIQSIYDLMARNKEKLNSMSGRLKHANLKIEEFQKMIERLNQQLTEKDTEIAGLKDQLERLNIELTEVTDNYNAKLEESNQKTSQLNTGYYAFGTAKELKTQGVITKEGGFIGIGKTEQLMKDFNKKYFTKIDITQTTSIPLGSKKARILTTHPSGSYKLEGPENKVEKLVITNPEEFWSSSKYLVIIVE